MTTMDKRFVVIWLAAAVLLFALNHCHGALPAHERDTLLYVAAVKKLSHEQTRLLLAIRQVERGYPGYEMGYGWKDSRWRGLTSKSNVSLYMQASGAADSIRLHYHGPRDLRRYARRYCERPRFWEREVRRRL